MKVDKIDIVASFLINIIIVVLYIKFLRSYFGGIGIVCAYVIASAICVYIYVLKGKEYLVDVTLGGSSILVMLYVLLYKRSWTLFVMEIGILVVVYSISSFYFDWKKLDQR